jgi:hypothetical protein
MLSHLFLLASLALGFGTLMAVDDPPPAPPNCTALEVYGPPAWCQSQCAASSSTCLDVQGQTTFCVYVGYISCACQ